MTETLRPLVRNGTRVAPFLFLAAALVAIVRWQTEHPLPLWWDEANYANFAINDHRFFRSGGFVRVAKALVFEDPVRPPAYRAMALPVTMFIEPTLPLLRGIALFWAAVAGWVLFVAWRRVVDPPAALFLVALSFLTPSVIISVGWFGTEYPLLVATALLMAALIPRPSFPTLTAAIALGLLSKSTFLLVAFFPLLVAMVRAWRGRRRDLVPLAGGSLLGAVIAAGWWMWHLRPALAYAQYGRTFPREATDSIAAKLRVLFVTGIGPGVALALLLLIVGARHRHRLAVAASVPLLAVGFTSPVFVPRHFSPSLLPLPLVGGDGLRSRLAPIATVAAAIQAAVLVAAPLLLLPRVEQTDWGVLQPHIQARNPRISYLGGWSSLSPPEVRYAWLSRGANAEVRWLWNAEEPPIEWNKTMKNALASDAVFVVSPQARASRPFTQRDNTHNAELITRLEQSGRFGPPVAIPIGQRELATVVLFVRK